MCQPTKQQRQRLKYQAQSSGVQPAGKLTIPFAKQCCPVWLQKQSLEFLPVLCRGSFWETAETYRSVLRTF